MFADNLAVHNFIKNLSGSGLSEAQAEIIASGIIEHGNQINGQYATREDVRLVKEDVRLLKEDVALVKEDVRLLKEDVRLVKEDVRLLDVSFKSEIQMMRRDMDDKEVSLRSDMKEMESSIRSDMKEMETSIRSDMSQIRTEIVEVKFTLINMIKDSQIKVGAMIVGLGGFLAAIKFFG